MGNAAVANIEQQILTFLPDAINISIDSTSVSIGIYDPHAADPRAPYVFYITIDSKTYHASALPSDDQNSVTLTLIDPQTNAVAYSTPI
jgi:hypothetical protein